MKTPQVISQHPTIQKVDRPIPEEMKKAAEGLEAVFTSEMMKAMRSTVEPSEFSLHNSASDVYQGMLDQEYADISAKQKALGLSQQIIDYWLREHGEPKYNQEKGLTTGSARTGGTHEGQSNE